jgi:hypothetical protein
MWQPLSDAEIADAGLIRLSDLGAGWTEQPRSTTVGFDDLDDVAEEIAVCKNYWRWLLRTRDLPIARSAQYTNGTDVVQNSVRVHPRDRGAVSEIRQRGSRTFRKCIQALCDETVGDAFADTSDIEGEIDEARATVLKPVRLLRAPTKTVINSVRFSIHTTANADVEMLVRSVKMREGRAVASYGIGIAGGPDSLRADFFSTLMDANMTRLQLALVGVETSA